MLSTRLPDKAYPMPYLLIMTHTLIYIVCIQQRSSLSLVESKLPRLADKDVSPSAQTEPLRSQSKAGFGSGEKEQVDHGKGKLGIGRMQGLHRNVQSCQYQGRVAMCTMAAALAPGKCSFLDFREHLLKLTFAVLPIKQSLFLFLIFLWHQKNKDIHDHLLNLL